MSNWTRYLVGADSALAELLSRSDSINERLDQLASAFELLQETSDSTTSTLDTLLSTMFSIEERAAVVVKYLDTDRKAKDAEIALLREQLLSEEADDSVYEARIEELEAAHEAASAEALAAKEQLAEALSALDKDAAEEGVLGEVLAPIEAEFAPVPEPEEPIEEPAPEEPVIEEPVVEEPTPEEPEQEFFVI